MPQRNRFGQDPSGEITSFKGSQDMVRLIGMPLARCLVKITRVKQVAKKNVTLKQRLRQLEPYLEFQALKQVGTKQLQVHEPP